MTDNEIIENLKLHNGYGLIDQTLKLIYRQKAEIEELRSNLDVVNHTISYFKSEAIKEFAERLKPMISPILPNFYTKIDKLVKEMAGDS